MSLCFLTVLVNALQHGKGVDKGGDESNDLSTGQRLDADSGALGVGRGSTVGGSRGESDTEALASVQEGGVGHHLLHLGDLLLDLGLELADLVGIALELVVQGGGVGSKRLLLGQLSHGLASGLGLETRAERGEGGVGLESAEIGRLGSNLGLESIGLGGVVVGELGQEGGVVDNLVGLLDLSHLSTVLDHVLLGKDDIAAGHQSSVARESVELGGGVGSLGLELGNLGGIVLQLVGQLGGVGSQVSDGGELGDLLALRLGGGSSGVGVVLVALGSDQASEAENENGGELHFDGFVLFFYKKKG